LKDKLIAALTLPDAALVTESPELVTDIVMTVPLFTALPGPLTLNASAVP
jgi:hypothetical protein